MSASNKNPLHVFHGNQATVTWDERLCIHAGECTRAEQNLFGGKQKPWGRPDDGTLNEVKEVVTRCPTGALTIEAEDGSHEITPPENTVVVSSRGPLYLSGHLELDDAVNQLPGTRFRAALCRCGQSNNKPFCDNRHESTHFEDRGAVGVSGPGTLDDGGPLSIKTVPNGPLKVSGHLTIISASGRVAWRGEKAALCRCGASENKPFCDGKHSKIGFKTDYSEGC